MKSEYGFGDFGKPKMEAPKAEEKPKAMEPDGDEGVTVHVHKKGGKFHSKVDKHDGFPPDENEHESHGDAMTAVAQALEEKYGEGPTEEAEEKVSPGIHQKVGDYLKHSGMMK